MRITKIVIAAAMLLVVQFSNASPENAEVDKLTAAISATPNDDKLYTERGAIYFRNRKFTEAIGDAGKALQINPKNINALNLRGNAKSAVGDYDAAIADFSQVIALLPVRAVRAYAWRGEAYLQKYDLPKALNDFNKALEIDPKLANAYYGRAKVHEKQDEYNKAAAEYTLALQNTPAAQTEELAAGFLSRGKALQSAGKSNEAAADFARVAESNTKSFGEAAYFLGMMLYKIGKNAEAEKLFLRAKEGKYADAETLLKSFANQMQDDVAVLKEINSYNARIAAIAAEFDVLGNKLKALAADDYAGKAEVTPFIHQNTATQMATYKEQLGKFPKKGVLSAELEKTRRSATEALNAATELNRRTRPYRVAELRILAEQSESTKKADVFFAQMKAARTANDDVRFNAVKQKWQEEVRITREIIVRGMVKLAAFNDPQWVEDKKAYDGTLAAYDQQLKI